MRKERGRRAWRRKRRTYVDFLADLVFQGLLEAMGAFIAAALNAREDPPPLRIFHRVKQFSAGEGGSGNKGNSGDNSQTRREGMAIAESLTRFAI